jgi:hypothetical protein
MDEGEGAAVDKERRNKKIKREGKCKRKKAIQKKMKKRKG